MKKLVLLSCIFSILFGCAELPVYAQTKDSTITVSVTHDTTYKVTHDSTYVIKVPVITPSTELRGEYVHPDNLTIGNASSEDALLTYARNKGMNMLNLYARAKLYTSTDRAALHRFVQKAKIYGITKITVDVRLTDSREFPGWQAYFASYGGEINPLAEFEPYNKNSSGVYDYPGFFTLLQKMDALTAQYGVKLDWYEGWIGANYSNKQAAVDSMVYHCGIIFVSNYVSVSDYTSSSASLGPWDNRMDGRLYQGGSTYGGISISAKKFNKVVPIVEIQSLETTFLFALYACPATSTNKCNDYFGTTWTAGKNAYKLSPADVLQWTQLIGRTMFYSKLTIVAQPN